ncbi:MAG: DUF2520 domain-containing protein [Bdellovibrionales bacterium]
MGQVPVNKNSFSFTPSYGIIGDGRMAQHMAHYFRLREIPFKLWSRKLSQVSPHEELFEQDILLVLLRDSAIENFIEQNPELQKKTLIHFSGSLVAEKAYGMHPLMTFGNELYDLETYERIPFVLEKGRQNFSEYQFQQLFPRLKNPHFEILASQKPLYHALCVMGQNFTNLLWQKFFKSMNAEFLLPEEALKPILEQTFINLLKDPYKNLTGPIARGDTKTIKANLEALRDDPYYDVYEAFLAAWTKEQKKSPPTYVFQKEISQ